jgi:predicted dehydrogenase
MINAGIIGVSGFGECHYLALKKYFNEGKLKLAAATIINPDEEKEKCAFLKSIGCRIFSDWQEMLDEFKNKLDFVSIPTSIQQHAPMTIAALEAGANVLVEKPAAVTIQEITAMRKAENKTGKHVLVGYQHLYHSAFLAIKRNIVENRIGTVKRIKTLGLWPRVESYYTRNSWAGKLKSNETWVLDSPFNNALAHYLNLMLFLAGSDYEKSAKLKKMRAELYRIKDIESPDTSVLQVITKNGIEVMFAATHASQEHYGPELIIEGSNGKIIYKNLMSIQYLDNNNNIVETVKIPETTDISWYPGGAEIPEFMLNIINNVDLFYCNLEIASKQTIVANAAYDSSSVKYLDVDLYGKIDGDLVTINGIESILRKCFIDNIMPSETGVVWGQAGEWIDLKEYNSFSGGKLKNGMK